MARGWDILIGLAGSHGSFLDQSLCPGGQNAFIGHIHTNPWSPGWGQFNLSYLAERGRLLMGNLAAVTGEQMGAEQTPLALLVFCGRDDQRWEPDGQLPQQLSVCPWSIFPPRDGSLECQLLGPVSEGDSTWPSCHLHQHNEQQHIVLLIRHALF